MEQGYTCLERILNNCAELKLIQKGLLKMLKLTQNWHVFIICEYVMHFASANKAEGFECVYVTKACYYNVSLNYSIGSELYIPRKNGQQMC